MRFDIFKVVDQININLRKINLKKITLNFHKNN